jgi:hypothetical protein
MTVTVTILVGQFSMTCRSAVRSALSTRRPQRVFTATHSVT